MQPGRIFYERLWIKKGCFENYDEVCVLGAETTETTAWSAGQTRPGVPRIS
jgi:hypothetical protein